MKSVCVLMLCVVVLAGVTGCVSLSKYKALVTANEKQKGRIDELGRQVDEARLAAAGLRGALKTEAVALDALKRTEQGRDEQITVLNGRIQTLADQIEALLKAPPPIIVPAEVAGPARPAVSLPSAVVKALQDLAAEEPTLEFDSQTGRCRFASDILFVKGSDTVRPAFERVLKKFAAIFTGVGKGLDLRIEGHTDSLRIRNVGTRAAHPTNWHLSGHRAIEVLRVLFKAGIDQDRMKVVCHGSRWPIADNRTAAGRARNRRVEIFVVGSAPAETETVAESAALGG